eukprot:CAMPEP_0201567894 /NCGR_PEP_ID=MMETSP0190_2-20130828/8639_1 /ASSEMBLY_ACC=CAM_ASM_000263 /TAXON_ID=37353 /ORGANISM="Rosalina sp." /LENGTH=91 /DNA_ID=CAMNT_0047988403 /DNA_START=27 /DNA_END=303 /DNA_ORIENTATION=+
MADIDWEAILKSHRSMNLATDIYWDGGYRSIFYKNQNAYERNVRYEYDNEKDAKEGREKVLNKKKLGFESSIWACGAVGGKDQQYLVDYMV